MTRKRAIALARAAVVRECPPGKLPPCWPAVERGLELALKAGVVIGMRKAGKHIDSFDERWVKDAGKSAGLIRDEANRLARKLRGKRA